MRVMNESESSQAPKLHDTPAARTIDGTCVHYGWTRSFVFKNLATGDLKARKAGRRTLITTESADQLFENLPAAQYTTTAAAPRAA
jgi:hypothetical protein